MTPSRGLANHDLLKISLGIGEILGTQLHITRLSADFSHRDVHGVATNRRGDIGKTEPVGSQGSLRELNGHLFATRTKYLDLRNVGQARQLVAK